MYLSLVCSGFEPRGRKGEIRDEVRVMWADA